LIWLLITWLPYYLRKFGFDIWLLVSFNLQIYHLIGSKDRMYMSSECSKNVNAYYIYMNWSHLDLSVYYSTYCCPWLHLVCLCILCITLYIRSLVSSYDTKSKCAHIFNFGDKERSHPRTCVGLTVVASCSWLTLLTWYAERD
jgi:hypothetical protein